MRLNFLPIHIFRETPQVLFFDAGVEGSNGSDVVIHHDNAISPPNDGDFEQYYVHQHQTDHNLVIDGSRIFTLLNPEWDDPHHIIYLNRAMGALIIPIRTFHRSISNNDGSIVLNQAVRDKNFNPEKIIYTCMFKRQKRSTGSARKGSCLLVLGKRSYKED